MAEESVQIMVDLAKVQLETVSRRGSSVLGDTVVLDPSFELLEKGPVGRKLCSETQNQPDYEREDAGICYELEEEEVEEDREQPGYQYEVKCIPDFSVQTKKSGRGKMEKPGGSRMIKRDPIQNPSSRHKNNELGMDDRCDAEGKNTDAQGDPLMREAMQTLETGCSLGVIPDGNDDFYTKKFLIIQSTEGGGVV